MGRQAYRIAVAGLLAGALGASGCGSTPATGAASLADLAGDEWTLVELEGAPLPDASKAPTASFEAGAVAGFSGCNRYRGPLREVSPGAVEIGPVAGTMMMCDPPAMEIEGKFLAALGKATRYGVASGRLSLDGGSPPAGRLVFERR